MQTGIPASNHDLIQGAFERVLEYASRGEGNRKDMRPAIIALADTLRRIKASQAAVVAITLNNHWD